ncbi:MAG TPA: CAP domain-containing protein [Pyrinomonadaceae bacterium]|jgi:uncharacterized protein YkwD|nr:CAP domain-containing protein [Pyrinomonadaceae bacterium]
MKNFLQKIRVLLIFVMGLVGSGQIYAQTAKPKPTPKPKAAVVKTAAPSRSANGLSPLEAEIFSEINTLRANPGEYIKYLQQLRPNFSGTLLTYSNGTRMITNEGVAGIDDAIATLKKTRSLPAFKLSPGLARAAGDHLADLIKNNYTGHKGADGSWPPNRVDRYGFWSLEVKENISYYAQSVRDIVVNMLIDDGNPKRDHRKNLLSTNLRFAGLSAGESKMFGRLCVVVFAGEFSERSGK